MKNEKPGRKWKILWIISLNLKLEKNPCTKDFNLLIGALLLNVWCKYIFFAFFFFPILLLRTRNLCKLNSQQFGWTLFYKTDFKHGSMKLYPWKEWSMWNFIKKNQKLITFSPQKRKHNTKLEEKRPKKTLKRKSCKSFFYTKLYVWCKRNQTLHKKMLKFYEIEQQDNIIYFNIII
jgi:hypothetical protein